MIKGIITPLPTIFRDNKLDLNGLASNVNKLNETKLSGYLALGSNGEAVYLNHQEKLDVIKTVVESSTADKTILAGTGLESIDETIELTNEAAELGVKAALVLTPSYYAKGMSHKALVNYFTSVANDSKIPILIYNVPKFTNLNIDPKTVADLSKHPNIIGIKNTTENMAHFAEIASKVHDDFCLLVGTASVIAAGTMLGAKGGILALANIAPNQCVEVHEDVKSGKIDSAVSKQCSLLKPNKAVTSIYGIAGLKRSMDLLGYHGGDPREPLMPFDDSNSDDLKQILIDAKILNKKK